MALAAHGVTHPGRRPTNEDALLIDLPLGLFVVADGMGGHNAGEIASDLAITTIQERMAVDDVEIGERLEDAVRLANARILEASRRRADYTGMGTTVSAVVVDAGRATYVSVGDSRVYRMHGGGLTQLTRDDSWLSNALATGMTLTQSEIDTHPMRHVLTEVVGVRSDIDPTVADCGLAAGDVLLVCSDGLHGAVQQERMASALASGRSVDDIAASLVEQALARGATDNVTALVVRFD
jgi:PPM family protein phosphatase